MAPRLRVAALVRMGFVKEHRGRQTVQRMKPLEPGRVIVQLPVAAQVRAMPSSLSDMYRAYIACLNSRNWPELGRFVDDRVVHNGRPLGLSGYRGMLEADCRRIPDLQFNIDLLVAEPPFVASRLLFDVTPQGTFLDLPVNGRRVSFSENVFYRFAGDRIAEVWSVVDKAAIEAQL